MSIEAQKTTAQVTTEVIRLSLDFDQEDIDALVRAAALVKFREHLAAAGVTSTNLS